MSDNRESVEMHVCRGCGNTSTRPRSHPDDLLVESPTCEACRPMNVCPGCGQLNTGHQDRCPACLAAERAPQGEQHALFTPPPTQLAGQLHLP